MIKKKKLLTPLNVFLTLIILLAIFLRFYNLENSLMFLGDQGRDALVVSNIFKDLDPVFIGPVTSIGNMYLGPFYYYFMLPFLWISYPSPMGPVYAVAALGVLTVFLLFKIAEKIFNKKTAILATLFFALSATVVSLSRFSWNPNPAPFFSLLMFYFTYLAWKKDGRYWILVSLMFSILIQLHYVALLSAGGAGLILLTALIEKIKDKKKEENIFKKEKKFFFSILAAIFLFVISLTPLMLFDYKHDYKNLNALKEIVVKDESFNIERQENLKGLALVRKLVTVDFKEKASQVLFETSFAVHSLNHPLLYLSLFLLIIYLIKNRNKVEAAEWVLGAYLFTGIIGISVYQHNVYTHYIAYLFPFVYLLYGLIFSKIKNKFIFWLGLLCFFTFFIQNNIGRYPLATIDQPISEIRAISEEIYAHIDEDEKYNLVLLAPSQDLYGMNYRYFLSTFSNPPVKLEDHHRANKLFIINEEKKEDEVWTLPIYEILVFPNKEEQEVFQSEFGPEITILKAGGNGYNEL